MQKSIFYDSIRASAFNGKIDAQQLSGFELILAEADRRQVNNEFLSAILATTAWETGFTMQPVREAFWVKNAEAWRKKNLRYWPYYGRGYVQLTWTRNYQKATDYFVKVLGIDVDFVKNPDLVMKPEYSAIILFQGMLDGWFTNKKLSDYLDGINESDKEDLREFTNSRRIINGTDKQVEIGLLSLKMEKALRASGRAETGSPMVIAPAPVQPAPQAPAPKVETKVTVPAKSPFAAFLAAIFAYFNRSGKA